MGLPRVWCFAGLILLMTVVLLVWSAQGASDTGRHYLITDDFEEHNLDQWSTYRSAELTDEEANRGIKSVKFESSNTADLPFYLNRLDIELNSSKAYNISFMFAIIDFEPNDDQADEKWFDIFSLRADLNLLNVRIHHNGSVQFTVYDREDGKSQHRFVHSAWEEGWWYDVILIVNLAQDRVEFHLAEQTPVTFSNLKWGMGELPDEAYFGWDDTEILIKFYMDSFRVSTSPLNEIDTPYISKLEGRFTVVEEGIAVYRVKHDKDQLMRLKVDVEIGTKIDIYLMSNSNYQKYINAEPFYILEEDEHSLYWFDHFNETTPLYIVIDNADYVRGGAAPTGNVTYLIELEVFDDPPPRYIPPPSNIDNQGSGDDDDMSIGEMIIGAISIAICPLIILIILALAVTGKFSSDKPPPGMQTFPHSLPQTGPGGATTIGGFGGSQGPTPYDDPSDYSAPPQPPSGTHQLISCESCDKRLQLPNDQDGYTCPNCGHIDYGDAPTPPAY